MIKPLNDFLFVKLDDSPEKTEFGFVIKTKDPMKPKRGKVVAVGPGKGLETGLIRPMTIKVGDEILMASHAGAEVVIDKDKFVVITETDVFGVLNNEHKS